MTSLSSISFVALYVGRCLRGGVRGGGRGYFESNLVIGAKKSLFRKLVNAIAMLEHGMLVVVAECGLLLAWGRGVPL